MLNSRTAIVDWIYPDPSRTRKSRSLTFLVVLHFVAGSLVSCPPYISKVFYNINLDNYYG